MKKYCHWCDMTFDSNNKNQIYCGAECRKAATKEKIAERYKMLKAKSRAGKERKCGGGCGTILSMYNDDTFCPACSFSKKKLDQTLKEIKELFDYEQR